MSNIKSRNFPRRRWSIRSMRRRYPSKLRRVKKLIPQSGITAVEYDTPDADVAGRFRKEINGPLISSREDSGVITEEGIIDQAVIFVLRVRSKEKIEGTRRVTEYVYPPEVLRMVSSLFNLDRLEIIFYTAERKVKYF